MSNPQANAPAAFHQVMLIGLSRALDAISGALAALSRSRAAGLAVVVTLAVAVMLIGMQELGQGDLTVYDTPIGSISASMGGRYLRVMGVLDPARVMQTRVGVGPITLRGGTWVALVSADGSDAVWVAGDTLPAGANGALTLVGRLALGTGREPPIYLNVGAPPDIVARDRLACAGGVAGLAALAAAVVAWLARRALYALPLPGAAEAAAVGAPPFVFFADAGPNGPIRNAPVGITTARREAAISGLGWRMAIRTVRAARPLTVATRFGALPALRVRFDDERGLLLDAVIAAPRREVRDALARALVYVGS